MKSFYTHPLPKTEAVLPSLSIDHLGKSFRDGAGGQFVPVFSSFSICINGPSIISIVGPNGVGKTTLLKLVAGILEPDEGTVQINGQSPTKCRIGYVPQGNPVFPWRRVADDIAIPLEIFGMPYDQRRTLVRQLVEQFSFDLPLERRTYGLSGGQRQLVNLCRALVGPEPPDVLLLDEPFAALDMKSRQQFLEHLERVFAQFQLLIILTTHQLDLAVLSADSVLPFKTRPVTSSDVQAIPVSLPRPRGSNSRATLDFQQSLAAVETGLFRSICTKELHG